MAYQWQFHPRPYSDQEAAELLAPVIDAETADWHYNKHHKGYVDAMNKIEQELDAERRLRRALEDHVGTLERLIRDAGGNPPAFLAFRGPDPS